MGTIDTPPSEQRQTVRADTLDQVEPEHGVAFVVRPYSLTYAELGGLPAVLATTPTPVRVWVRYPATANQVHGMALAWTPRAVYVEWEDGGTHLAWVWASAVERAPVDQAVAPAAPERPRASGLTLLSAELLARLVHLVNGQLQPIGAEFITATTKPTGPFSAVVYGTIDGHRVHLDFSTEQGTNMCVVALVSREGALPEPSAAPTFEKAIEAYSWAAAIDAPALADETEP
jgi:hypothetical protein